MAGSFFTTKSQALRDLMPASFGLTVRLMLHLLPLADCNTNTDLVEPVQIGRNEKFNTAATFRLIY
jgi:hypothetical protein